MTLIVMGAFKMPIIKMHKSSMVRKNSRRRRLQQPFRAGAGPLLSKPDLVETISAPWRWLVLLAKLIRWQVQGSRADLRLSGDPCRASLSPLGVVLTCLFEFVSFYFALCFIVFVICFCLLRAGLDKEGMRTAC